MFNGAYIIFVFQMCSENFFHLMIKSWCLLIFSYISFFSVSINILILARNKNEKVALKASVLSENLLWLPMKNSTREPANRLLLVHELRTLFSFSARRNFQNYFKSVRKTCKIRSIQKQTFVNNLTLPLISNHSNRLLNIVGEVIFNLNAIT